MDHVGRSGSLTKILLLHCAALTGHVLPGGSHRRIGNNDPFPVYGLTGARRDIFGESIASSDYRQCRSNSKGNTAHSPTNTRAHYKSKANTDHGAATAATAASAATAATAATASAASAATANHRTRNRLLTDALLDRW